MTTPANSSPVRQLVACYGEALVDVILQPYAQARALSNAATACLGGSVFNFCLASARQGLATAYLNPLSADAFGKQFQAIMRAEGIELPLAARNDQASALPTSLAMVQLQKDAKASYIFHRESVADRSATAMETIAVMPTGTTLLHTGCLTLVPQDWPTTRRIVEHARARDICISLDANLRPAVCSDIVNYRAAVMHALSLAHVAKVSDDDLQALGLDISSPLAAAQELMRGTNIQLLALTLGAQGAWLLSRSAQVYALPPSGLKVVDTVGAGDCFYAGLLACLAQRGMLTSGSLGGLLLGELQPALVHAIAAASINVQRSGCDPATWQETVALTWEAV